MSKIFFVKKKISQLSEIYKRQMGADKLSLKNRLFYVLGAFIVLVLILLFFIKKNDQDIFVEENITEKDFVLLAGDSCDKCFYRSIDGKIVKEEKDSLPFLLAVVIDNHPFARPAFGLSKAEIVYDIPAEGGINRYLAFFTVDGKTDLEIGPVRSARPYFLDIASEYGAILVHCGGSPEALARISKEKLLALNEFYNGKYFRRYSGYEAPHNVLANLDLISSYLKDRNYEESIFDSWKFVQNKNENKDEMVVEKNDLKININNGQHQYSVDWEYDLEDNVFLKKIAGNKHFDSSGERIIASNVILHYVGTQVLDKALRLKIELLGKNAAVVCVDGICERAYWKKENQNDRTRYYYQNNEEVVFNSGKTWVHFIDENTEVSY